jgi:Dyp-type peroxidase family
MDFANDALLNNLQGNIIKGHGRDHTTHIFLHFDKGKAKTAKKWIKHFAEEQLTSCKEQLRERERYKRNKIPGGLFAAFFLTAAGYKYMGLDDVETRLPDAGFNAGMKNRRNITNDPELTKWERGYDEILHAMILLADHDKDRMSIASKKMLDEVDKFARISVIEYGNAIRNANGDGLEHFGYVDGISQPLFLQDEIDDYFGFHSTNNATAKFNPAAEKELVLIPDPYATEPDSFGSYFVFRKLEQNVKGFKKAEEAVGKELFPDKKDEDKRELAGAYIVGRFEDGTPVVMSDEDKMIGSGNFNNFNYDNDPSGGRCPHFAHIRKTNPRRSDGDKTHTMARRGIPYGHRDVATTLDTHHLQQPEKGVGLLFMSYQASIENQFEFIQMNWANNPDFEHLATGLDPIIGQGNATSRQYKFPDGYGSGNFTNPIRFNQFVYMKGGEYFFAPSMGFLKHL